MCMASKPELGRAVGDGEITQGDVGDEIVWELWMWIGVVFVNWLTHAAGVCQGVVGRNPVEHWPVAEVSVVCIQ